MKEHNPKGIGTLGVIGIVLVILKLFGLISLSWKWVLLPFWGPGLLFLVFVFVAMMIS